MRCIICFSYYHKYSQHDEVRKLKLIHIELRIILSMDVERYHIVKAVLPYTQSSIVY